MQVQNEVNTLNGKVAIHPRYLVSTKRSAEYFAPEKVYTNPVFSASFAIVSFSK